MDVSILAPLIIIFIVISFIMMIVNMLGIQPSMLLYVFMTARRRRTEIEPRDHFDRWDYAHRRAAFQNRPRRLRYLKTTGDRFVPERRQGTVSGVEPWLDWEIFYLKARRWSWSAPYFVPNFLVSDLNRRTVWVDARAFTKVGPIYFPIPNEGATYLELVGTKSNGVIVKRRRPLTINVMVAKVMEAFRFSMDQQLYSDILEDMNWSIGMSMAPPMGEQAYVTASDQHGITDTEYLPEETATGGGKA
jgi:hypothetical protein